MRLAAGDWQLELDPVHGGMIRALRRSGADILRPSPAGSSVPFESACFPLAPYANRIAHGRFDWQGEHFAIPTNHPEQKHPLHGTVWLADWTVEQADDASATLVSDHAAGADWPWAFRAEQRLSLTKQGLHATLLVTNTDERAQPVGLGFHPWFSREGVTGIAFDAQGLWLADEDMLPREKTTADALGDWSSLTGLERPDLVDHCYTGWQGTLRIARKDGDVLMQSSEAPCMHLFIPPGRDFFCAEPQTTMPDAVNREAPVPLQPGERIQLSMAIVSA